MKDFHFHKYGIKAALYGAALLFFNCNDDASGKLGELNKNFADRTTINAFLTYKDSGKVTFELKAPLVEEFTLIDSSYTIMRKGVKVKFWDKKSPKPNYLSADWAKVVDREKLYEGKGNVKIINYDGDTLLTEHLFWNNAERQIYTKDTVTIKRLDGSINISNNGMKASEDFKDFIFYDNHGIYIFDESNKDLMLPKNNNQTQLNEKTDSVSYKMIPLPKEK